MPSLRVLVVDLFCAIFGFLGFVLLLLCVFGATGALAAEPASSGRYVVIIRDSPSPIDPAKISDTAGFESYHLYTTSAVEGGRARHRLRLGFFETREEARKVADSLKGRYSGATVEFVSRADVRNSARSAVFTSGTNASFRQASQRSETVKETPVATGAQVGTRASTGFDHMKTGFQLTGGHARVRCEGCHSRGIFTGTPNRCAGCHGGGKAGSTSVKPVNHIPVEAPCDACHSSASWKSSTRMDHGAVSAQCVACHNGKFSTGRPSDHLTSGNICRECHTTRGWRLARFDHTNISGSCSTCHNGTKATGKPPTHITSTNVCEDCHTPSGWRPARMNHTNVTGSCSTCHNGTKATGKPPTHITSTNVCEDCHTPSGWRPARMNHTNVTGSCSTCHNGTKATGKPPTHITSTNVCEDCHTPSGWRPARMNHTNVTGSCSTCHNGTKATGKPPTHIASGNVCEDCHTPSGWRPARMNHTNVTGSCSTCHNGTKATGKPPTHFVTSVPCEECHSTAGWRPILRYRHTGAYPGDHGSSLVCLACHKTNTQTPTWTYGTYKPDCAGCHAGSFKPGEHQKTASPAVNYTVSELRNCAGACHEYTDSSMTTIRRSRTGEHRVTDGGF